MTAELIRLQPEGIDLIGEKRSMNALHLMLRISSCVSQ